MNNFKLLPLISFFSAIILLGACSNMKVKTSDNYEVVELPDGSIAYLNHNSSITYDK